MPKIRPIYVNFLGGTEERRDFDNSIPWLLQDDESLTQG